MAIAVGKDAYLGFGGETTWGAAGTIDLWKRIVAMTPRNAKANFLSRTRRSTLPRQVYFGPNKAEFEVTTEIGYTGDELLVASLFGGYSFTADTPVVGVNVHSFSVGDDSVPGITAEAFMGLDAASALTLQYTGLKCNKIRLDYTQDQPLAATYTMTGKQESSSYVTPTSPTIAEDPVLPIDMGSFAINGVSYNIVSGFIEFSRPRATERSFYGNDAFANPIINGPIDVMFEFVMEWGDDTTAGKVLYDKFRDGTTTPNATMSFTGDEIASTGFNRSLGVTLNRVNIIMDTPSVQDDGIVQTNVRGIAVDPNLTAGGNLSIIMTNGTGAKVT